MDSYFSHKFVRLCATVGIATLTKSVINGAGVEDSKKDRDR